MVANDRSFDASDGSAVAGDAEGAATSAETVLQNGRRREILRYLAARGGEVDLSSLALDLAAGGDETLSVVIAGLHDCHLPKLATNDLLSYEDGDRVTLLIDPDRAEALVSRVEDG